MSALNFLLLPRTLIDMADIADKLLQLDRDQEETKARERAQKLGIPYIDIVHTELNHQTLKLVPKDQVEALQCIPLMVKDKNLVVGVVEPESAGVIQGLKSLEQMTGYTVLPSIISASGYAYGHKTYELMVRENEGERPVVITDKQESDLAALARKLETGEVLQDVNVTDTLSAILAESIKSLASDVHFEPLAEKLEIRFRIDGVLHKAMERPIQDYRGLVSRIKYLAKMPLGATSHPQDGRFTITVANTPLDLRVSSLPTIYGDMITVRILRKEQILRKLLDLGLRADLEQIVRTAYTKPHGMVLVCGPTGSGKTTTLYAIVQELNSEARKIITIEDPVEYKVAGLEQSQVDPEHQFDFAQALRGALRQDPDVLMIGEIRDTETASIGIRAALTGHIVLATMHANDAPSAYSRLLEMGVEPFLFSGSINVVIAQRLLRLLCESCKKERSISESEKELLGRELGRMPEKVYEAVGCNVCGNIGFKGRIGIFEAFVPSHQMEQLALEKAPVSAFEEQAHKDGMITMLQDGLLKVEQGVTSIAEVLRVTSE